MQGRIIKGIAGFYYVYAQGRLYECKAKGIFRKDGVKPMVGDEVEMEVLDEAELEGNVTALLPRHNALVRPAVANVDQAMILFAIHDPEPNLLVLDRFIVIMRQQGIPVILCVNKSDLADEGELDDFISVYRNSGCRMLCTSIRRADGLSQVRECLAGRTTVVAGPSGAGKSSLTNALQQEIRMETGTVSRKLGRGRHTTRHSQIIPAGEDTFVVDTPGFTSLFLPPMEEEELRAAYAEFEPYEGQCRFQGCRHIHEPDCAVKAALEAGAISRQRYDGYVALCEEVRAQRRY